MYSCFICDLGTVKLLAQGEGDSVCFVFLATVQNTIPDTEGQLFDCSKIPYEITVLLPDQLKKKEEVYSFCKYVNNKTAWEIVETIDRSTVRFRGPF